MLLQLIEEVSNLRRAKARKEVDRIIRNAAISPSTVDHDTAGTILDLLPEAGLTLDDVRRQLSGAAAPTGAHLWISPRHGYADTGRTVYALALLQNNDTATAARHTFEPQEGQPADEFEELLLIVGGNGRDAASRRVAGDGPLYDQALRLLEKNGVPKVAEFEGGVGAVNLAARHSLADIRLAVLTAKYRKRTGTLAESMAAAIVRALTQPNN
jgi:hypothetical protein